MRRAVQPGVHDPSQLLDAIPELRPIQTQALVARKGKGEYVLTPEADDQMASATWDELFCIYSQLTVDEPAASSGPS